MSITTFFRFDLSPASILTFRLDTAILVGREMEREVTSFLLH